VEALDDAVGLWALSLCPGMVDILDGEVEFVFMPLRRPAVSGELKLKVGDGVKG
jgi:hypothetical protein